MQEDSIRKAVEIARNSGQEQLTEHIGQLDEIAAGFLARQILGIDFTLMKNLFDQTKTPPDSIKKKMLFERLRESLFRIDRNGSDPKR
jgi:hypothetical protein